MKRISKRDYYLGIAKAVAKRSTCLKRRYGCVIVNNDEIIATGYNGSPRGGINCCDVENCKRLDKPNNSGIYDDCHSIHAEQNALISASRKDMLGGTIYLYGQTRVTDDCWATITSPEPCPICKRMIVNAGLTLEV